MRNIGDLGTFLIQTCMAQLCVIKYILNDFFYIFLKYVATFDAILHFFVSIFRKLSYTDIN